MEIPADIQKVLRCVECDKLLSYGPVLFVHETNDAICGRCTPAEQNTRRSRNIQYEAIAKLHSFPCTYANQGCSAQMDFSEQAPNTHEHECADRTFICPVVERGECTWIGCRETLREHCRDAHPAHLFNNSGLLPRPDLRRSHLVNYLITAFDLIFLLHLKICVSSGKLYHCVRMFGKTTFLDKFSYCFKIKRNGIKLSKDGSILQTGILTLQEHSSNSINVNSLLDLLGDNYDNANFSLTIRCLLQNCLNCFKLFENVTDSSICPECRGKLVECEFSTKGCLFVDTDEIKCGKHAYHFCEYQTKCRDCEVNFVCGSFIEHLTSPTSCCPNTIKLNINSVVRTKKTMNDGCYNYIIFSTNNIGTILCPYSVSNSNFELGFYSSLPFYELKNFKCSIELTDPKTKHTELLSTQIINNDWYIRINMNNFPSVYNVGLDMKVNIT